MRCTAYCIAKALDISNLVQNLIDQGSEPKYYDEVIHFQKEVSGRILIDIFLFGFGSIVFWGSSEHDEKFIIDEIQKFSIDQVPQTSDSIYYKVDENSEKPYIDEEQNEIILNDNSTFLKLSISHALAQSVKLNVLENSVSDLLEKTTPIQQELATTGSVSLPKKELSKKIGILFNERYSINIHSDILDTPEFFWRRPSYEPIYLMTAAFQDIQTRHNILNNRLDTIHELYSMLSNELNYKHSTRLEMIVIVLIAIEIVVALTHIAFY